MHRAGKYSLERRGFTTIELLVVVGIVLLVIGLLIRAITIARQASMRLTCASNLRQWGMAMQLYANQEHGWLPRRGQGVKVTMNIDRRADWFNSLPPAIGGTAYTDLVAAGRMPRPGQRSIWICPSAADHGEINYFSYGMNMWLSPTDAPMPDRLNRLGSWSETVFMADAPGAHCSVLPRAADYSPVAWHRQRINICFLDGHVSSYTSQEIGCGVGDPNRSDVRWVIPAL